MNFWNEVFHSQNINWLLVLIIGTATTSLGTVITNAITVARAHNEIRLWSEVLANQHLTYVAFFPALIAAFDLEERYKNACFAVMLFSFLFFVLGLLNVRRHDSALHGHHACSAVGCTVALDQTVRNKIIRLNIWLGVLALILALSLIFSLQFGKKAAGA